MKKKRKFPRDVARFFHVEKSFNEAKYVGTHQREKLRNVVTFLLKLWHLQ